jgi:F-type H+-transporting ATPase subunit a
MFKKLFLFLLVSVFTYNFSFAQHEEHAGAAHGEGKEEKFNIGEMIMHHIKDSHEWEFAHGVTLPLPVMLWSDGKLNVFSSSRFHENGGQYNGFINEHEHIYKVGADGKADKTSHVLDFSITKNVASLLLSAILLILVFTTVAKGYIKNTGKAPSGLQSVFEPIILFLRDEIIKPAIGKNYLRYFPYLLTLFFFIWFNNLLGLLPGGVNLTGNIAVTVVLAIITFIIVHLSAKKGYFMHLIKPPGVPIALLPIMVPVEIVGVFMKPISLALRLFANITAGHIIMLSFIGLTFIFKSYSVGVVTAAFSIFMTMIELLVAFLQAFIFTLLSSMYIGGAIEEHHHDEHH